MPFETLPQLRKLDLSDNKLIMVKKDSFKKLQHLVGSGFCLYSMIFTKSRQPGRNNVGSLFLSPAQTELNLGRNRLEVFEPDLLSENADLRKLDVSANRLTEIPSSAFNNNK